MPMEWVVRLFKGAMAEDPTGYYALDGYPRTLEQATALATAIAQPATVLVLDVPVGVATARRGAAAAKGIRVFKGRTAAFVALAQAQGIVRCVLVCPVGPVARTGTHAEGGGQSVCGASAVVVLWRLGCVLSATVMCALLWWCGGVVVCCVQQH